MGAPIIRFEMENMKINIATMIAQARIDMDQDIANAVNNFFTDENISSLINEEARRYGIEFLRGKIRGWFNSNEGGLVIEQMLVDELSKRIKHKKMKIKNMKKIMDAESKIASEKK